ncbi:calmodulin-like 3 [Mactra antiquata]
MADMVETFYRQNERIRPPKHSVKRKQEVTYHTAPAKIFPKKERELSEQEIKDYTDAFLKFDADNSGTIDVRELMVMLEAMGIELSASDVLEMLAEYDEDESGTIEFDEFLLLMASLHEKIDQDKRLYFEAFKTIDTENEGELGPAALKSFMSKLGSNMTDKDVKEMIKMADKTGSGKLTFDEFVDIMMKDT